MLLLTGKQLPLRFKDFQLTSRDGWAANIGIGQNGSTFSTHSMAMILISIEVSVLSSGVHS